MAWEDDIDLAFSAVPDRATHKAQLLALLDAIRTRVEGLGGTLTVRTIKDGNWAVVTVSKGPFSATESFNIEPQVDPNTLRDEVAHWIKSAAGRR